MADDGRSPFARPDHEPEPAYFADQDAPHPRRALDDPALDDPAPALNDVPAPPQRIDDPAPSQRIDDEPAPAFLPRERRTRPRDGRPGLWAALVVGVALLAVLALFAARSLLAAPAPKPAGPEEVAQHYLQAIAAGDAQSAQNLAAIKVQDAAFTNEGLADAARRAPLTDIRVDGVHGQDVVLAYRVGGRAVRGTFPMVHVAEGWRVKRPTVRARVTPQPQMVAPSIDGQKLHGAAYVYDVELAPGVHRLSLPEGFLAFEQPDITVTSLTDTPQVNGRTQVTAAYPAELKKRLQDRIRSCVAAKDLAPKGCPWAFRAAAGETVDASSITYTLGSDPFASFVAPRPGTTDAIVRGELRFPLKVTAKGRSSGSATTIEDDKLVVAKYEADLAAPDLPVIWAT